MDDVSTIEQEYSDIESKIGKALREIRKVKQSNDNTIILWDESQASTVLTYFVSNIITDSFEPVLVINNTPNVDVEFAEQWASVWGIPHTVVSFQDALEQKYSVGDTVPVTQIDPEIQQLLLDKLRFVGDVVELSPNGYVGNYLIEEVPVEQYIENNGVEVVLSSKHLDGQNHTHALEFTEQHTTNRNVEYETVYPLLPFTEMTVWRYTWSEIIPDMVESWDRSNNIPRKKSDIPTTVSVSDIPIHTRFYQSKTTAGTNVSDDGQNSEPAWVDFIKTQDSTQPSNTEMQGFVDEAVRYIKKAALNDDVGLLFTGGKDSMIILHLWRQHLDETPPLLIVDTQNQFESVYRFRRELAESWDLEYDVRENTEFINSVINNTNDDRGFAWDGFKTQKCCEKLKIEVIRDFISSGYGTLVTGRRSEDINTELDPITDRGNPLPHRRFHPLHNWDHRVVEKYITDNELPLPDIYDNGYSHTDCVDCTLAGTEGDDWVDTGADKRESLNKLRDLGYF